MEAGGGAGAWRFSTEGLPATERLSYFREVIGRSLARVEFGPVEGSPLKWAVDIRSFDDLVLVSAETSGVRAHRSLSLLSDGNDDLLFTIARSGFSIAWQVGRECRIDSANAVLLSNGEPGINDYLEPTRSLILRIPRRRLAGLVRTPEDALIRPISTEAEPVRLLVDYVDMALGRHQLGSPELRDLFARHVHQLVALAIGGAAEAADRGGLAAARLNAAKRDILRRLDDARLSIVSVASRLGITPRYLQMLFETEGSTFTEYVVAERLARAHAMLTDARMVDRTVTMIAFAVGFGHLSYFNRAFRRKYGATPSDIRAAAQTPSSRNPG